MTTSDWIAVVASAQTLAMMVAGFYVWSAGRRNVDLDGRFRLFRAELDNDWKDRQRDDRHELRTEMQTFVAKLQSELDQDLDDLRRELADLTGRVDRAVIALRPKS